MAQKTALGKGLASLLPSSHQTSPSSGSNLHSSKETTKEALGSGGSVGQAPVETPNRDRHMGITHASLEEIQVNHFQPRREFDEASLQELAQSIRTSGIIQPLVVRKNLKDGYELIAGERRLRAAKIAGLKQVPVVIRKSTDRETLEIALIENIQRQNLNCIDEALGYFQLIQDFSLTQEEVAEKVGKDRATVANYLRLLRLPEAIIDDLKKQILSFGHGKALLGLDDAELRMRARAKILENRLSVRETEALVDSLKVQKASSTLGSQVESGKTLLSQRMMNLSRDLGRHWSTKVEIKGNEQKGKIVIHYASRQDLDRILEDMQTENI